MTGKVNFFIVGAPKCGTTTLHHFLIGHPSVDFGARKEPHLFATDLQMKGTITDSEYRSGYDFENSETRVFGDASVMHLYSERAAENIFDYNPFAKILIMLRPPVDFLVSYHHEQYYNQVEDRPSLREGWTLVGQRRAGSKIPSSCPDWRFLDYGEIARFDVQLLRYISRFPSENVRVGFLDDMKQRPEEFIAALYSFLDLSTDGRQELGHFASAKTYRRGWQKWLVRQASNSTVQTLWRSFKSNLGITRRFKFVHRFRVANTISGEKERIEKDFAREIEEHYSKSWESAQQLSASFRLLAN
ncbi:sulfotransferase domain-containing protein [Marimonas sp. MJW-29]|uniref:Sulfotransferase domain-containing protein n=1 Tax=Sulfitobacter sediminis TaxID=3234186 RepID=A0ABV3RMY2_9RHOB